MSGPDSGLPVSVIRPSVIFPPRPDPGDAVEEAGGDTSRYTVMGHGGQQQDWGQHTALREAYINNNINSS